MTELEILQERIDTSGPEGVETAQIRDDYKPVGQMMIHILTESGKYVQRKTPAHSFNQTWRIFRKGYEPY